VITGLVRRKSKEPFTKCDEDFFFLKVFEDAFVPFGFTVTDENDSRSFVFLLGTVDSVFGGI